MAIGTYSIGGDEWLLVLILLVIINGYWYLFYWWPLIAIGTYFISGY
jgi:hypothetical protein